MTISEFKTDNGIATDEMFAPDYVRFDCQVWGLPDNTMGKTGWHVVYRPLAEGMGYEGHDLVTQAMRDAVRIHRQARKDAEQAAERAQSAQLRAAVALLDSIPAEATHELATLNAKYRKHFAGANEGGEGYVYQADWRSQEGREILARHGVDVDVVAKALEER